MSSIDMKANRCGRCGHIWVPRIQILGETKFCPHCKSKYWSSNYTEQGLKQLATKRRKLLWNPRERLI